MEPLISIVIPTKDRYNTLLDVIDSVLAIQSNNIELIVQDNSIDPTQIKEYLNYNKDGRLKYFHCSRKLSQTENSDEAVKKASGKYVCFIGDDDAVLPYIADVAFWMDEQNIGILKGSKPDYYWPGMPITSTSGAKDGVLKYAKYGYSAEQISTSRALSEALAKGGTSMTMLPSVYHGIVAKSILDSIYEITQSYFPGPSPDMANGIALCLVSKHYTNIDIPFVISGKSNMSIDGQGVKHKHVNELENVDHLPADTIKKWSVVIPRYWTGPTIWAESTIKSLSAFNLQHYVDKINVNYLLAYILLFHNNDRKSIMKDYKYHNMNYIKFITAFIDLLIIRVKSFFINRVSIFSPITHYKVNGIKAAIELVTKNIDISRLPFRVRMTLLVQYQES